MAKRPEKEHSPSNRSSDADSSESHPDLSSEVADTFLRELDPSPITPAKLKADGWTLAVDSKHAPNDSENGAAEEIEDPKKDDIVGAKAIRTRFVRLKTDSYRMLQFLRRFLELGTHLYFESRTGLLTGFTNKKDDPLSELWGKRINEIFECKGIASDVALWCDVAVKAVDPSPLILFTNHIADRTPHFPLPTPWERPVFWCSDDDLEKAYHHAVIAVGRLINIAYLRLSEKNPELTEWLQTKGKPEDSSERVADTSQNRLPKSLAVVKLCMELDKNAKRLREKNTSENQIAFEFAAKFASDAKEQMRVGKNLLRQARRYQHLWKKR